MFQKFYSDFFFELDLNLLKFKKSYKILIILNFISFSFLNIQKIQSENRLAHAKIYFKKFIDQELKKLPESEPENNLMAYEKAIDKQPE